jgi:hypothetical protein
MLHLKVLQKEEQAKPKISRREIIKKYRPKSLYYIPKRLYKKYQ